ncbi:MAG: U32 family peptidase [Mucinivorans sp.]
MIYNKIELLAPAGNLSIARAAINAGADAVYIGGPNFSARQNVGNSLADIEQACEYAHKFDAKVYLAINTLLTQEERAQAREMVIQARHIGVDAFIVQDMAFLEMDLPQDIILHASTQCANRTVERVAELSAAGFSRVVLERGLTISQIRQIAASTKVEIEAFVHGAICIGYSGECYLSEYLTGRSANRGCCAQPCRSRYDLVDAKGKVIIENQALLSLSDLNLSARLAELIDAGVHSLKIEGRLKDERYVANTVAFYNQKLIEQGVQRTSRGVSRPLFVPDVDKTFSRSFTEYFFDGPRGGVLTGGAVRGKFMGVVRTVGDRFFTLDRAHGLVNGDGVVSSRGHGTRINKVQGEQIFLLSNVDIAVGDKIYCNFFKDFDPRSLRRIEVSIGLTDSELQLTYAYGKKFSLPLPLDLQKADNQERARAIWVEGLKKSGDTIFEVSQVLLSVAQVPFMPQSKINELRRALLALYSVPRSSGMRPVVQGSLPCNVKS